MRYRLRVTYQVRYSTVIEFDISSEKMAKEMKDSEETDEDWIVHQYALDAYSDIDFPEKEGHSYVDSSFEVIDAEAILIPPLEQLAEAAE